MAPTTPRRKTDRSRSLDIRFQSSQVERRRARRPMRTTSADFDERTRDDETESESGHTDLVLDKYFRQQKISTGGMEEPQTPSRRSRLSLESYMGKTGDANFRVQQQIKQHFSTPSRRRHASSVSISSATSNDMSISLLNSTEHSVDVFEKSGSTATNSQMFMMMHQSSLTLPVANAVQKEKPTMKTDQIIESIVLFSFHIPRTVMEDLISHEINYRQKHPIPQSKDGDLASVAEETVGSASMSSLSIDARGSSHRDSEGFAEKLMRIQSNASNDFLALPKSVERQSALLFVDMSGFTKLSTILDVESLSKVINSYFDMIVNEVIQHGGDVLKFAGDAFFAEWKVSEDDANKGSSDDNPLASLNASLACPSEFQWEDDDDDIPKLSMHAMMATKCALAIVSKYSDYHASAASNEAMLNVHCGIGVGSLTGLHIGDYKAGQDEDDVEIRREFLILGNPIEQVSKAADLATSGEVFASSEAVLALSYVSTTDKRVTNDDPVLIASRDNVFIHFDAPFVDSLPQALQPYESLRMHCASFDQTALARLHFQMALYVHPVIRADEMALSRSIQSGEISQPTATNESRHRAEAELRSVFTMFINAVIDPKLSGTKECDSKLYKKFGDIMHVTSRELDKYSGHLRQFIVDDKGVVLIATFGLRGSKFPNMVANNALPATFSIHRSLKSELNVETRIGATFGKVYCGVVGGVRRHEFAVMGAPVNLAARLMGSKENNGILVDEAVGKQAGNRFSFKSLPPVSAKGYDKPVPILEPLAATTATRKKKQAYKFSGRTDEKGQIVNAANVILDHAPDSQSAMVFVSGESGVGKSALASSAVDEIVRRGQADGNHTVISARSSSNETAQRIPLSSFRQMFLSFIRDHCVFDGTVVKDDSTLKSSESIASSHGTARPKLVMRTKNRKLYESVRRLSSNNGRHLLTLPSATESSTRQASQGRGMSSLQPSRRLSLMRSRGLRGGQDFSDSSSFQTTSVQSHSSEYSTSQSFRCLVPPRNPTESGKKYRPGERLALDRASHHGGLSASMHGGKATLDPLSQFLHRAPLTDLGSSVHKRRQRNQSTRFLLQPNDPSLGGYLNNKEDDSSAASVDASVQKHTASVPYFEKLCWICEQLEYPFEYADIVGSQFLGLESANPLTHIDGHVPTMEELVEFLALAFVRITEFADLNVVVLDDFQWVDAFSWKIFRVLCKRGKNMLLVCLSRSHDQQALRRLRAALNSENELQSQMTEIQLRPLSLPDFRALIAAVLEVDLPSIPDSICGDLYQRTAGLPVFVIQVLENIKRKGTLEMVDGVLKWTPEGLKENKLLSRAANDAALMEETMLSKFDSLDVRVRKVLQTCAVLGVKFVLTDVIQVHPEIAEAEIESALDTAINELILVELTSESDENTSLVSGSLQDDDTLTFVNQSSRGASDMPGIDDRHFQFADDMWRKSVVGTMLKEHKIELHRLIAESMERNQAMILEQTDIFRLLIIFDHWKGCGDFCKSAQIALTVGARLEEWDLSEQSLDLYEDALELSYDNVFDAVEEKKAERSEWMQVKAKPMVLDLILRLHSCIGLCHQRLGDLNESMLFFEDAFTIINSASKVPGMSKALMMPILSSLCALKMEQKGTTSSKNDVAELLQRFIQEAEEDGHPVHRCRALTIEATRLARLGEFTKAVDCANQIHEIYDIEQHTDDMIMVYGDDFALGTISESVQWLFLSGATKEADDQANMVIDEILPHVDVEDVDDMMRFCLPLIQVLMLVERARDADWLFKNYVINPYHDSGQSSFWSPLFNPLAYVLELIMMEEADQYDPEVVEDLEAWVLDDQSSIFDEELEKKGHTLMGELCFRLASLKEKDDPARDILINNARDFLTPIARYPHPEIFLKHLARSFIGEMQAVSS